MYNIKRINLSYSKICWINENLRYNIELKNCKNTKTTNERNRWGSKKRKNFKC